MKKTAIHILMILLLCVSIPMSALAAIPTKHMDAFYVNDFADVMSDADEAQMIALGTALEDACGAQVVAVIVNFLDGMEIEEYGTQLFEAWKLGQVGEDNGVLLLLSVGDREITTILGTGIEDRVTHAVTGSYHDKYAIPYFVNDDFSQGMLADYQAHCDKVASIYGVSLTKNNQTQAQNNTGANDSYNYTYGYDSDYQYGGIQVVEIILGIVVLLVILSIIRTASRGLGRVGRPVRRWSWFTPGWYWFSRPRHHSHHMPHRDPFQGPRPRPRPPGGHSTSNFGGGFGGFGGGGGKTRGGGSTRSFGGGSGFGGRTGGGSGKTRGGGSSRKF